MRAISRVAGWASLALLVPALAADAPADSSSIALRPIPTPDFRVSVDTDRTVYDIGDAVRIRFRSSEDCRVYIFNTDSEGVTRQVFPNYYDRNNTLRSGRPYSIPFGRYRLVTTGPAGTESLRIVAYRRGWKALEPWEQFPADEPFPRRSIDPDQMRSQVQSEARAEGVAPSAPQENPREDSAIVPIVPPHWDGWAEDFATFRVRSHADPPDPWGEWSSPAPD